ncbi:MAG TPA: Gfo/Idh/MocA family oxidoreductase [Clostridiales bacterium]|jgi:predicted dehydrogenase|nr:Gfo/Idh/MocA family oxidoreductase [Clostridiales bacterium]
MFRIGIIGTENSHAMAFARLINLPDDATGRRLWEDAKVVGVYGPDLESAQAVYQEGRADFIAESPDDFIGRVDAMMITSRRGSVHYDYAIPFIDKGLPVFIDKPFTTDIEQSEMLIRRARETGALLAGGSGCKYSWDVLILKNRVEELRKNNALLGASMNFAADLESEYDGFHFYAPHLTEMALTMFGDRVRGVRASENNGSVTAVAHYDDCDVALHYTKGSAMSSCLLFGKESNYYREVDISMIYRYEVKYFIDMLRTGIMPQSYEALVQPVYFVNGVLESLKTGRPVEFQYRE